MRKIILAIVCSITCVINLSAQTVYELFKDFKDKQGVECVELPKEMLAMALEKSNKENRKDIVKKINNIRALHIEKNDDLCQDFSQKATKLKKNGYETMVNSTEDNEKALILVKSEGESITDIVVLEIEASECTLVEIKGDFNSSDIKDLNIAN